jgi:hypothetical protein
MKNRIILLVTFLGVVSLPCTAQKAQEPMVWIDLANPDAGFLQAAAQKKNVPVQFTTDKDKAQYIASVSESHTKGTALHGFYGIGHPDMVTLVLSVADAKTGTVVYSYTCKKAGARGEQSAADCLAKHWADSLHKR